MLKPRIQCAGFHYKTGTGQKQTDKYTWEDYQALQMLSLPLPLVVSYSDRSAAKEIQEYFEKHPEELLDTEPFTGCTLDEIQERLRWTSRWKYPSPPFI